MNDILVTDNLTKRFGNFTAVDRVNLHVREGAVYGLIGKNGAGKTTILRMAAGLLRPTEGSIRLQNSFGKRPRIGVLIETPALYPNLSAWDNMEILRRSIGYEKEGHIDELLNLVGLSQWGKVRARSFSLGMRQRLGLAMALVGDPELLILDEPINGLDPNGIKDVRNLILHLNRDRGKTVLISSHILEELSKTASDFGILNNGVLVRETTLQDLAKSAMGYIRFMLSDMEKAKQILKSMGIYSYQTKGDHLLHVNEQIDRSQEMISAFVMQGIGVSSCQVVHESLEDFYIEATGGGDRHE